MSIPFITIDDRQYRPEIMQACDERLDDMTSHRARVLLVRFDVHYPVGYPAPETAVLCSELMRQFREYYTYHGAKTHYVGVREQKTSQNPHYHVAFFIDASKFDSGYVMQRRLTEIWSRVLQVDANGLIHWCETFAKDAGLEIRRPRNHVSDVQRYHDEIAFQVACQQAMTWLLYLAKTATKGSAPFKGKEYFCSRL